MTERCILSVKYSQAGLAGVGSFLRYVQYRDHHEDTAVERETSGLLRYVAYRDRTSPRGQLFGPEGLAGDLERKELMAYVKRSTRGTDSADGPRPKRSVYRFVLSPEHAQGLDLQALTRATMAQLERDTGSLPPWVAAVHRNTAHPHVHIVLAAQREAQPGIYKSLDITKPRLARMKSALRLELARERGERTIELPLKRRRLRTLHSPHSSRRQSFGWLIAGQSALQRAVRRWLQMNREVEAQLQKRERELAHER